MYYSAGKYSAGTVRKHMSYLFKSASDGTRLEGVVPAFDGTYSMKIVPSSGRNLLAKTGLCVIADKVTQNLASQDSDQPGVYIAGVDDTDHAIVIAANSTGSTRYDLVYAEVSETSYVITNKALTSNVATITTSSAHGFAVNQTVVISGVDETFDGDYLIASVPSSTTFTYAKTASNVTSVAVTPYLQVGGVIVTISNKELTSNVATITATSHGLNSSNVGDIVLVRGVDNTFDGSFHIASVPTSNTITYKINRVSQDSASPKFADVASTAVSATGSTVATARVPFAVKVLTGTTSTTPALPSNTNSIALARVTVANGATTISAGNISDRRQLITSSGGVYIFDSSNTAITYPTLPEGSLSYDTNTNALQYYTSDLIAGSASASTVSTLTLAGDGSATNTASRSDHTHDDGGATAYLGTSQVTLYGDSRNNLFPSGSSRTVLSANRTYLFEGTFYLTITGAPYPASTIFDFNSTGEFTRIVGSFITTNRNEGSSIYLSGHFDLSSTSPSDTFSIVPTTSGADRYPCVRLRGFYTTGSADVTIEPAITSYATPSILSQTTLKFLDVGSSTVTKINGTWA